MNYTQLKKFATALSILCIIPLSGIIAQDKPNFNHFISIEYMRGSLINHTPIIPEGLLNYKVNTGIKINYERQTYGKKPWQARYNYPDLGYAFLFWDYNNQLIGKTLAFIPNISFHLIKQRPQRRHSLKVNAGFGGAVHTHIHDEEENPLNLLLGSRFSVAFNLEGLYQYKVSSKVAVFGGVAFTHFSNAASKKPNLGTNMNSINFGVKYVVTGSEIEYETAEQDFEKERVRFGIQLTGGFQESYPRPRGSFPFYNVVAFVSKRLSYKSGVSIGTEVFFTKAIKEDIKYSSSPDEDYRRIGMYLGYEWYLGKLSVITHLGYHLYRPYPSFAGWYKRIGFKYNVNEHFYTSLTVKAFKSKYATAAAEAGEFGIGYVF